MPNIVEQLIAKIILIGTIMTIAIWACGDLNI